MRGQGYRLFHCDECGCEWKQATRDYMSGSGETCPECGSETKPHEAYPDPSLKTDRFANLAPGQDNPTIIKHGKPTD